MSERRSSRSFACSLCAATAIAARDLDRLRALLWRPLQTDAFWVPVLPEHSGEVTCDAVLSALGHPDGGHLLAQLTKTEATAHVSKCPSSFTDASFPFAVSPQIEDNNTSSRVVLEPEESIESVACDHLQIDISTVTSEGSAAHWFPQAFVVNSLFILAEEQSDPEYLRVLLQRGQLDPFKLTRTSLINPLLFSPPSSIKGPLVTREIYLTECKNPVAYFLDTHRWAHLKVLYENSPRILQSSITTEYTREVYNSPLEYIIDDSYGSFRLGLRALIECGTDVNEPLQGEKTYPLNYFSHVPKAILSLHPKWIRERVRSDLYRLEILIQNGLMNFTVEYSGDPQSLLVILALFSYEVYYRHEERKPRRFKPIRRIKKMMRILLSLG